MWTGSLLQEYLKLVGSVYLISLIFYPFELLAPAEKGQPVVKRLLNLAYLPLILAAILLLLQPVFGWLYSHVLIFSGGGILPPLVNERSGFLAQLLFALFFAIVWDTWQYWVHRSQHAFSLLWETHKFHHSETAFNSSTQARHHISSTFLLLALYLPVLIIFGSQGPHYLGAFMMFRLWGFVNHMNVRLDLGPITPFIAGPQWHRIHHSIYPEHHDKNFAAFFPVIDIIFGTYYKPRKGEHPPTGLLPEEKTGFIRWATVEPFFAMHRIVSGQPGRFKPQIKSSAEEEKAG
jgi:sterol desaturase/sphingolipid hydroxylase (fatty acid hydroxylase superfamily)